MSKIWINHEGLTVPAAYVPKIDKKKDRVCSSYLKKAKSINDRLTKFKVDLLNKCDEIYQEMLEDADVKTGKKGNFTITSFDKGIKIDVSISEKINFDDNINLAQLKINEFLESKTVGIDPALSEIVNHAFTTTKGRLDTKRILSLFSLKIKDKLWLKAMELIRKSITRNVSKRYVRIWERDAEGQYHAIELNFSSI